MSDPVARLSAALADRYRIERELGAGGMATVYLAEDLRHHRQVALKVLKPEIAATLGAGRFAREIEVAARLQHPNILPLLDSGEAAGFFFYVMPYVEGESLRDRLARGGELPIPDAVRILMEVADALSEAHAHGVVHRDIKPDNVMLRGRHALVTDFGVAKAVTEATGHQMLTSTGVALGTPAYMAPEQATADPHQDHRVDIYALGVLGYELLTGRAPYQATTAAEMLAAHVTAEPEPLEKYRPTVSPALAQIILKCLAKKPADRWQTAEEVLQALEPLATPSGGTTPTQTVPVEVARMRRRLTATATAGGIIAVAAVAVLAYQQVKARPLTVTASDLTQVTNDPGVEFEPAISPDGNEVAYAAERRGSQGIGVAHLFVRAAVNVAAGAAVRLGDSAEGSEWLPSWTPDGQRVRYLGCRGGLNVSCTWRDIGKMGGSAAALPLPPGGRFAWAPDGKRLAFVRSDTLLVLSSGDTVPRPLVVDSTWLQWEGPPHSLALSPDGTLLAYVWGNAAWRTGANVDGSSLWIVRTQGGRPIRIAGNDALNISPAWLDDRHLLFVSDRDGERAVHVAEVGPRGLRGTPRVVPGIGDPHSITYSIERRRLAWAKFTWRQNIRSYPLDRPTPTSIRDGRPVTAGDQVVEEIDVSPDDRWVVYGGAFRSHDHLFKIPAEGGRPVPLTNGSDEEAPAWSPDGREIAYTASDGHTPAQIALVPADGGAPALLTSDASSNTFPRWAPNGLHIVFVATLPNRAEIVSRDSIGGAWHAPKLLSDSINVCWDWAPHGKALLCFGPVAWVQVDPQNGRTVLGDVLAASHVTPIGPCRYSRDGRIVYCASTGPNGRQGVWAVPAAGGPARLVVAFDDSALTGTPMFSVGRDRLYLTVAEYESDIWVATLKY